MLLILIIILLLAFGGGGYGYQSGWYGGSAGYNPLGILPVLLFVLVIYLLFFAGHVYF